MTDSDKVFVEGLFIKDRNPNAPDFVLGNFSIKTSKFKKFLDDNQKYEMDGWLNITFKKSQNGKKYAELDLYQYNQSNQNQNQVISENSSAQTSQENQQEISVDDIPF